MKKNHHHQVGFKISPEMINRAMTVWPLTGPCKDVHRVVLNPHVCYLCCVLRVVVLLKDVLLPQSEVKSASKAGFHPASIIFPFSLTSLPSLQHYVATTILHCRDGIGLVMSYVWFPPNMTTLGVGGLYTGSICAECVQVTLIVEKEIFFKQIMSRATEKKNGNTLL